jgi:L-malate glycosyltransferase
VYGEGQTSQVEPGSAPASKLRILLVIKCLGFGGAERLLVDTVARGDRHSFEYEVAYVLAAEHALVPDIVSTGTPVHGLEGRGNTDMRWMGRLRRLIVDGRFDVVHFHLPYTAALGRLVVATLPSGRRPAVVYTEHSLWNKMAVLIKGINRATIGRDQALVVVSEAAHDALPHRLKARARVIVHGVDLSRSDALIADREAVRAEVRAELGVDSGDLLALTVANLRPEKGYDVLLDAARLAADRGLPLRFAAVGRGPLEDELRERSRQLGLEGRLQFLGQRHDVLRLLTAADLFVLASRQEGLPVSLMEATSTGAAIVATSVGGVPQVITDGVDGLVIPPGDPPALVDALERLVGDPGLRAELGRAAKLRSAMFDVTSACRQMEEIYRDVAGARR